MLEKNRQKRTRNFTGITLMLCGFLCYSVVLPFCLLADGMLGRLARWLRLLGYDTEYRNDADDLFLARQARAQGRVLLTRDRELASRKGLRTLLIESETLEEQIHQVREALGPPPEPVLSRCSLCNVALQPAAPDAVKDRVPPYVLRTQEQFRTCSACGRVYWAGTHLAQMQQQLERFSQESQEFESLPENPTHNEDS